jgi:3-hydroxy-5-methyl-1-naphthoate 3-O-methyltransferase
VFAPTLVDQLADLPARSVLEIHGAGESLPPRRHDLHLLTHLLHRWNALNVRDILARSFDALLPGGWIVDHDVHLNADKSGPLSVARYSALLLHTTEGQCWSISEIAEFLGDAGFVNISERPTAADRTAILAQKPASDSGPFG